MPGIVLTFPILPGKVEAWRRFCQQMAGARSQSYEASRRRLGITRERMALVENAFGAAALITFEAPNIGRALEQIISSNLLFDGWYRERLEELHGVSLTRYEQFAQPAPPALPQELLFEWSVPDSPSRKSMATTAIALPSSISGGWRSTRQPGRSRPE